jgi:homoserine kinase type II
MAVYTDVSEAALAAFLKGYGIGAPVRLTGILQGIENSNFVLETTSGKYVLTIFERRAAAEDLPYFLGLMAHLAAKGFPAPLPISAANGTVLGEISGKPAAIVTFLAGEWPQDPSPGEAFEAGKALARLHIAAADFAMSRPNTLGADQWAALFAASAGDADEVEAGLAAEIDWRLKTILAAWPQQLPSGAIHADMFPDNLFLKDGQLSGVIDYYFACTDAYAYDLAITLNAWCFGQDNQWRQGHCVEMLEGYQSVRPLSAAETAAMPILLQGAAMRFLLTRLYDWLHPRADALANQKDPLQQRAQLRWHQDQTS